MKGLAKYLPIITGFYGISLGVFLILTYMEPVYIFGGGVHGYTSLVGSKIIVLGESVRLPLLEYVRTVSVLLFIPPPLIIIASALLMKDKKSYYLVLGSSLTLLTSDGILYALIRLINTELSQVVIKDQRTSAGLITFPHEVMAPTPAYQVMTSALIPALTAGLIILSFLGYYLKHIRK